MLFLKNYYSGTSCRALATVIANEIIYFSRFQDYLLTVC